LINRFLLFGFRLALNHKWSNLTIHMELRTVPPESERAAAIMQRILPDERSEARESLHVSALADCPQTGCTGVSALIRDVTPNGVFFFAHFIPAIGAEVSLSFNSKLSAASSRVFCRGTVVRVERFISGAAGIALRLTTYQVLETPVD
jgi:hypothetical protein